MRRQSKPAIARVPNVTPSGGKWKHLLARVAGRWAGIRSMSIGFRLAILVIGVISLMLSATVPIVDRYRRAEQARTLDALQVAARVLGQAIAGEFDREHAALAALASSPALAKDDFREFHAEAKAFLARISGQPGTFQQYVIVYGPSAELFVTTGVPFGIQQPSNPNALEFVRAAIESQTPVISNLFTSATLKLRVVTTNVPVIRDGHVPFVLAISSMPERYRFIIGAQGLPEGWISTVLDRNGVTIARDPRVACHGSAVFPYRPRSSP